MTAALAPVTEERGSWWRAPGGRRLRVQREFRAGIQNPGWGEESRKTSWKK